jgi:hypothetical protein
VHPPSTVEGRGIFAEPRGQQNYVIRLSWIDVASIDPVPS